MARVTVRAKGRLWCFTENTNARTFYDALGVLFGSHPRHIRYICGQMERAATGQNHFQGYVQLLTSQAMSWLKNNISRTAHWEKQRGTNIQAKEYCSKDDTQTAPFVEYGTFSKGKGARMDVVAFKDAILKGTTQVELLEEYTMCMAKFPRFYGMGRGLNRPKRTNELTVRLNLGDTGTGKTRYAYDNFPKLYSIPLTSGTMWFDGYDLQETVLLDDFAGALSKFSLTNTLQLLDRYPIQVPIKGGYTWFMPTLIIITSNLHPSKWYKWEDRAEQYSALLRRITEVFFYEQGEDPIGLLEDDREEFNDGTRYIR